MSHHHPSDKHEQENVLWCEQTHFAAAAAAVVLKSLAQRIVFFRSVINIQCGGVLRLLYFHSQSHQAFTVSGRTAAVKSPTRNLCRKQHVWVALSIIQHDIIPAKSPQFITCVQPVHLHMRVSEWGWGEGRGEEGGSESRDWEDIKGVWHFRSPPLNQHTSSVLSGKRTHTHRHTTRARTSWVTWAADHFNYSLRGWKLEEEAGGGREAATSLSFTKIWLPLCRKTHALTHTHATLCLGVCN